jgi:cytosine/adenosine deaminase-related metal-dependent hydrolase
VTRDAPAPGQDVIRYEHGLITPGFVNLHAHCIRGGLFRGIPDDLEMEPFIPKLVYNILLPLTSIAARELSPEELRAVTALGMIDLIKGGTTTLLSTCGTTARKSSSTSRASSAFAPSARRSSCRRPTRA